MTKAISSLAETPKKVPWLVGAALGSAFLSLSAHAAIYMQIEGVMGDVTARGYEGWVDVSNVNYGISVAVDTGGGGSTTGRPNLTDVSIQKLLDVATIALLNSATTASRINHVNIAIVSTCQDQLIEPFRIELSNAVLTGISHTADGLSPPEEAVTMAYERIVWTYRQIDPTCRRIGEMQAGYDVAAQRPL